MLKNFGLNKDSIFYNTVNTGHSGILLSLTSKESTSPHNPNLPYTQYVANMALLQEFWGNLPF